MERDRQRFGHRRDGGVEAGHDPRYRRRRQHQLFGEAAVADLTEVAEMEAEICPPLPAHDTAATGNARVRDDAIADRERADIGANLDDLRRHFVTGYGGNPRHPLAGTEIMQVRSADTGRKHLEPDLAGRRRCGRRHVLDAKIADAVEPDSFHVILSRVC